MGSARRRRVRPPSLASSRPTGGGLLGRRSSAWPAQITLVIAAGAVTAADAPEPKAEWCYLRSGQVEANSAGHLMPYLTNSTAVPADQPVATDRRQRRQ